MAETREVIENLSVLQFLSAEARKRVVESFSPVHYTFGNTIVREGDEADAFYVIASGKARVVKQGDTGEEISLNVLHSGDSFGDAGLLEESTRSATVRAASEVDAFRLDKAVFDQLLKATPEIRISFDLHLRHQSLSDFFRLYSAFAHLPAEAMALLLERLEPVEIGEGEAVFHQGEPAGPMYVVEEGRLRVFTEDDGQRNYLRYLRKGDFFGELSLFKSTDRTATVEAVSPCRLLKLDQETFAKLIAEQPDFKKKIEQRIAQYDFRRVARVPLDFEQEVLPAETRAQEKVSLAQVEQVAEEKPPRRAPREGEAKAQGPFASPDGFFVKKGKRLRRFPYVRQIDEMDCGAAALAMVCRFFGRSVSLARIRQLLHTSTDGTSLKALCRGAEELGLAARAVKASKSNLDEMPLPAIVHWHGNHWMVLFDVDQEVVRIADPAIGLRRIERQEFEEGWTGYAALFDYTAEFEKAPEGKPSAAWLIQFFKPFLKLFAQSAGLALIVSILQMVLPVFTQVIVDRVLVQKDLSLLNVLVLSMFGVLIFSTVAMFIQRYLLSFAAVRIDSAMLDFLTRKLLALPMSYFNSRRTGDIQRRLAGLRQVREFIVQQGVSGLTALTQLVVALLLMFIYSPVLALVFLATVPLYAGLMRFSSRWLKPIFDSLEEAYGRYGSRQIDAIRGIETVKALGAEGSLREIMLGQFHGLVERQFKSDLTMMSYQGAVQTVTFLSLTLFLWVGAHEVMNGSLTIGGLVAFNSLVVLANAPISILLGMWDNLQLSSVLLSRLNDVFEQEPEQGSDHSRLLPVKTLEGEVRFQNLGFRYGGPEAPMILDSISIEIPAGKMVAIVGRSGSGKTTLIKCLAGLLEPTEGTILYDGVDMKTLNYRDLRRRIGFVLQENYLFDETIARNIAFGEDEPDMDAVLWAARVASAHEFIDRMPLGYDTRVGESGVTISGGQKQRIAIARALYHRPPILVFDEATSALDTESERAVKENLDKLLEGRTSFVIAHRLSTIRDADLILVMEKGKIVEQGTHDELMERQGLYYYLSSQQLSGM